MQRHLSGKTSRFRSEHRLQHGDGTWRWVVVRGLVQRGKAGKLIRFAGSLMDLTGDKTSDSLTGLPNRLLFNDRLCRLIQRSQLSREWRFAVLFVDVDRFKQINDRFGHIVGDRILLTIAQRLTEEVRAIRLNQESLVARFAGDEFVILLDGVENEKQAKAAADQLHTAVNYPISCQGDQIQPQVSIGITMASPGLTTPESFLQSSDTAMYQVKAAGGGGSTVFEPRYWPVVSWNPTCALRLRSNSYGSFTSRKSSFTPGSLLAVRRSFAGNIRCAGFWRPVSSFL